MIKFSWQAPLDKLGNNNWRKMHGYPMSRVVSWRKVFPWGKFFRGEI